jgi:hypothetical protein
MTALGVRSSSVAHIDLFDGPPWEARGFWDDASKPRSRLTVAVQMIAGLVMCLAIPICFEGVLFALGWGWERLITFG